MRISDKMNWGIPDWKVNDTKHQLELYIADLKREGKEGWVYRYSSDLYEACGSHLTKIQFGRHLKILNVPSKHSRLGTLYAIFIS